MSQTLSALGTTYGVTQFSYDRQRLDCVAVRLNPAVWASLPTSACTAQAAGGFGADRIVRYAYDDADRALKLTLAYGTADQADEATRSYTLNGQAATLADGQGNLSTYVYDGFDRLSQTRYPQAANGLVSSTSDYEGLSYDAAGNVTQRRLRDGQVIGYAYDALNRVTFKDVPNTVYAEGDVTTGYDLLSRPVSVSSSNGITLGYAYDALGRVTSEANNVLGARSLAYDAAGQLVRLTHPDGFFVTYDYLVTGEVSAIRESGAASGAGVLATYGYDDFGRRTRVTRGNGVVTSYGYDPVSRLSILTHDLAGTARDVTTTFSYNPASQLASTTRSNDAYAWTASANTDRAYAVNGLNQVTIAGTAALAHDGRGNVTSTGGLSFGYTCK